MNSLNLNNKERNKIITKTTSLALASILITSMFVGLIPIVVMPAAAANTYLSTSSTKIGTNNAIKITITDPSLSAPPTVTLAVGTNSTALTGKMYRTALGDWILFIANATTSLSSLTNVPSVINASMLNTVTALNAVGNSYVKKVALQDETGKGASTATLTYGNRGETVTLTVGETKAASVTADRAESPVNATLIITVTDPTENVDPTVIDTSALRNYNYSNLALSLNGQSQTVLNGMGNFTETGADTGIFTLSVSLATIAETHGDLITVTVTDDDTSSTPNSVDVTIRSTDGVLNTLGTASFGSDITLSLLDADRNLQTLVKETPLKNPTNNFYIKVVATIGTSTVKTGNLTVVETDKNTGNFTGKIVFTHGTAGISGNASSTLTISVPVGSSVSVTATYYDPVSITTNHYSEATFSLSQTAATIAFGQTAYLPSGSIPAVISVNEPDANDNALAIEILTLQSTNSGLMLNVNHTVTKQIIGNINITQTTGLVIRTLNTTLLNNTLLIETGKNTGVFELRFDLETALNGTRTSGDTMAAKYRDKINKITATGTATIGGTLATVTLDRTSLPLTPNTAVTVKITVTDADANTNIAAINTATVTLTAKNATNVGLKFNTTIASLPITVTETGQNTGIFTGSFTYNVKSASGAIEVVNGTSGTRTSFLSNDGSGNVTGSLMIGGTFTVSYTEPLVPVTGKVTATGTITPTTSSISVSPSAVILNQTIIFTVTDPDSDTNTASKQSVTITLYNTTTNVIGTLSLTETANDSGIFNGSLRAGATGILLSPLSNAGTVITAKYSDPVTATSYYATGFTTQTLTGTSTIVSNNAAIILDATSYGPYSTIKVNVTDPDLALSLASGVVLSLIKTSADECRLKAATTKLSDGTFQWTITLNPGAIAGVCTGTAVKTALVDTITVYYVDAKNAAGVSGNILTKTATIAAITGSVSISPSAIIVDDFVTITVTDMDRNTLASIIESVNVVVTTDSWSLGQNVTLPETGVKTGIFEAKVKIVAGIPSTTNEVRGATGDTITVSYKDRTDAVGGVSTVTVSGVIGVTKPPLERVPAGTPATVDASGNAVSTLTTGSVTVIQTPVTNDDSVTHIFTYIVQIKDANGVVVSINWIQGLSLASGSSTTPGISWTPDSAGQYTVEVFVWESLSNAVALSPVSTLTVTVV